jgi:hypothetical protein
MYVENMKLVKGSMFQEFCHLTLQPNQASQQRFAIKAGSLL